MDPDAILVKRFREGDDEAFDSLLERYERRVYGLVCRLVGEDRAEDGVQEVWLSAYRSLPQFRGEAQFRTWLFGVTMKVCAAHRRRDGRRTPMASFSDVAPEEYLSVPDQSGDPEQTVLREELRRVVRQAIATLPPPHRVVVHLRQSEGLSYQEIAEVLGIPLGTVRSRLHYAMEKLATLLRPYMEETGS